MFCGFSQERFEFGQELFDGLEVWAIGRQEEKMGASGGIQQSWRGCESKVSALFTFRLLGEVSGAATIPCRASMQAVTLLAKCAFCKKSYVMPASEESDEWLEDQRSVSLRRPGTDRLPWNPIARFSRRSRRAILPRPERPCAVIWTRLPSGTGT